jgi:predicted permease
MNAVIDIAGPVFLLAALGYLAARLGWVSDRAAEGLARFVFDWAVPVLLLRVFASTELPAGFPWRLLVAFYGPAATVYLLGVFVARRWFRVGFMEQVISGFGAAFGNSILVGLPLVLLAFGDSGTVPYFMLLSVHALSYFSVTTVLLETGRRGSGRSRRLSADILRGLVTNPILIGLASGLLLNWLQVPLPGPVDRAAWHMQQAVAACSLFSLGASLTHYRIAGELRHAVVIVALKNMLMPALVWLLSDAVFALPLMWSMAATLLAALPTGVNVYIFAQRYHAAAALATTTVFLSTAFSMFSLSVLLFWFQSAGFL